jgi:hypothetical protein
VGLDRRPLVAVEGVEGVERQVVLGVDRAHWRTLRDARNAASALRAE